MLRLQLMSDLHLEFHADSGRSFVDAIQPAADTLVLAGDIVPLKWYSQIEPLYKTICSKFKTVVMVPGNHEYYGSSYYEGNMVLDALLQAIPNLRVLEPGVVLRIGDHRIVGATMWFKDDYLNAMYKDGMNDFDQIQEFVPWVYQQNNAWQQFMSTGMRKGDIVVTHHLPSYQLVAPKFVGNGLNRFFVSECDKYIHEVEPALWLFGHTHSPCDRMVGNTRCVANPFGYVREVSNTTFKDQLVLEVP